MNSNSGTTVWERAGPHGPGGKKIAQLRPAAIDINMGCPAPKVVNNGEGGP